MINIERIFDGVTTVKASQKFDFREYTNLSIQVKGMGVGDKIRAFGSVIDGDDALIPFKINKSYEIVKDGIYVIPPLFRFYKYEIFEKATASSIKLYTYCCSDGDFTDDASGEDGGSSILPGLQMTRSAIDFNLTDVYQEIGTMSVSLGTGFSAYLSELFFSIEGTDAEILVTFTEGSTETTLYKYVLSAFNPTFSDIKNYPFEIPRNQSLTGIIKIKAKKKCSYETLLSGRVSLLY